MPRSRPSSATPAVGQAADQAIVADLVGRGIGRELAERASLATGNSDTARAFRWTVDHFAGELKKVEKGEKDMTNPRPTSQQATSMLSREKTPVQRLELRSRGRPASAAAGRTSMTVKNTFIPLDGPSPTILIRDEVDQWRQDGKPVTPLPRKSSKPQLQGKTSAQHESVVERLPHNVEVIKARAAAVKPPMPSQYQKILEAKIQRADEFLYSPPRGLSDRVLLSIRALLCMTQQLTMTGGDEDARRIIWVLKTLGIPSGEWILHASKQVHQEPNQIVCVSQGLETEWYSCAELEKANRRPATAPRQQAELDDIKALKKELDDLKEEVRTGILGIGAKPFIPPHGPGRRRPGMYYGGRAICLEHVD